jgi:hypothetical protein
VWPISLILTEGAEESHEIPVRIVSYPAKNRTGDILTINEKLYGLNKLCIFKIVLENLYEIFVAHVCGSVLCWCDFNVFFIIVILHVPMHRQKSYFLQFP